jgi:hypothetical protein
MSRMKTGYGHIRVCGVVVEDASREGGGSALESCRSRSGATSREKRRDLMTGMGGWVAGGVRP